MNISRKITIISTILILLISGLIPSINSSSTNIRPTNSIDEKELFLVYGEAALKITAQKNLNSFNLTYSVPPLYEDQVPILVEIKNDTTANITNYTIVNDTKTPNKMIELEIGSMKLLETKFIRLGFWVLIKNKKFDDLPETVQIPDIEQLPEETKKWLNSTEAVQSDNILIKLKAQKLRGESDNLIDISEKITNYTSTKKGRAVILWLLNILSLRNKFSGWFKYLDALSSLFLGGSCTGRANLGTALYRANNVPSRVLHVMPTWINSSLWMDMHYISEYYCPDYGWIMSETTTGITPLEPKENMVLRICYPEDEDIAGNRNDYYGGCEQWFWYNRERAIISWDNINSGNKAWMLQKITTNQKL